MAGDEACVASASVPAALANAEGGRQFAVSRISAQAGFDAGLAIPEAGAHRCTRAAIVATCTAVPYASVLAPAAGRTNRILYGAVGWFEAGVSFAPGLTYVVRTADWSVAGTVGSE